MSEQVEKAAETPKADSTMSNPSLGSPEVDKTEESLQEVLYPEVKAEPEKTEEQKQEEIDNGDLDIKLPEESSFDDKFLESFKGYAKELGLNKDQAQALIERENKLVIESQQNQIEQQQNLVKEWLENSRSDKEYGGQAFDENVSAAKKVVERFGSEEFKAALSETGLGNHPELIRFVYRISKEMNQGEFVRGGVQEKNNKSMENWFYPEKN